MQKALTIEVNSEGIIAQYEGYFNLKEIDWQQLKRSTAIFIEWIAS